MLVFPLTYNILTDYKTFEFSLHSYSDCVREFLCVDDPPGPHDSLEESRVRNHILDHYRFWILHIFTSMAKQTRVNLIQDC